MRQASTSLRTLKASALGFAYGLFIGAPHAERFAKFPMQACSSAARKRTIYDELGQMFADRSKFLMDSSQIHNPVEALETLRMATDAAEIGVWDLDVVSGELNWSDRCREIFGVTREVPLRYEDFLARLHESDLRIVDDAVMAALDPSGPGEYDIEYRVTRPDGETRWAAAKGKAFFDGNGGQRKAVRFIGTILDRTENKLAQEDLAQARRAQEAAIAVQRFLLQLTDSHRSATKGREIMQSSAKSLAQYLSVNRVGYSEASADKKSMNFETGWAQGTLKTLSGSVPMEHWSRETSNNFTEGRTVVYPDVRAEPSLADEVEHYTSIGAISVVAVPFLRNGVWRGSLYVNHDHPREWSAQDVALIEEVAVRTAEAVERAQAEEEVRALANRLSMAQETGQMASWQWDFATGNFVWDGGSQWTYGRPPSEMQNADTIFGYLVEEDREKVRRDLAPAIAGTGEYRSEFKVIWPDDSIHCLLAFGRTVRSSKGEPVGLVGININVTEQKKAEQALLQTEKLAAVGRLASSIAHEINNPLESVTNLLYLAGSSDNLQDVREYLSTAERELRRVSVIANQTLRFHKQSTRPTFISSEDLFESALSIFQGRLVVSNVHVESRLRAIQPVECFEGEIRQVLNNLIGNAIDAMHARGGTLFLRSRDATHPVSAVRGTVLTVADTGPGMSNAVVQKVFEPFFTTKEISGTGLGLWVSKDIADRHLGSLRVRSSQQAGRCCIVFTLFLPAEAAAR